MDAKNDNKRGLSSVATWYGDPQGDGSEGGACGYRTMVGKPPFSSMISAGNGPLFRKGLGCGACYEVKCTSNIACSGRPITVTITDECNCDNQDVHFDLSGTAFGAMAKPGQAQALRNAGKFAIKYKRVPCKYPIGIEIEVDPGSSPYYLAVVLEYIEGDGDVNKVEMQGSTSNEWVPMRQSWGATWKADISPEVKPPYSLRIITSKQAIVANQIIPTNWQPGTTYASRNVGVFEIDDLDDDEKESDEENEDEDDELRMIFKGK